MGFYFRYVVREGLPDKVIFGQMPEWGRREPKWLSRGRVPKSRRTLRPRACLISSRDNQEGRVLGTVGEGKSGGWGQRHSGTRSCQAWSATIGTLPLLWVRSRHWKVLSKGVTWAHLCFKKVCLAVLRKIDWREEVEGRNESREASEEAIAVNSVKGDSGWDQRDGSGSDANRPGSVMKTELTRAYFWIFFYVKNT